MDKILCFKLNNDELYLDQILVDYTNIPIFFICKGKKDYYLVLLTDYNNYNYIIVTITKDDIYNLLTQKITMKAVILKQNQYWEVITGDKIKEDKVTLKPMNKIDLRYLPADSYYYTIESYRQKYITIRYNKKGN